MSQYIMEQEEPKNLETNFNTLCITPDIVPSRMRPRSLSESIIKDLKVLHNTKKQRRSLGVVKHGVIRPAKLNVPSCSQKSPIIRPAKLKIRTPKLIKLKPATLIVNDENNTANTLSARQIPASLFSCPNGHEQKSRSSGNCDRIVIKKNQKIVNVPSIAGSTLINDQRVCLIPSSNNESIDDRQKLVKCEAAIAGSKEAPRVETITNLNSPVGGAAAANQDVNCDDTSIDELASYFDNLVHIPKKMSTMAEMMYI